MGVGRVPLSLRIITGIEAAVYGALMRMSGWVPDDAGYGVRDPLADHVEGQRTEPPTFAIG